jgi:uncharacterized phiE125 gp8 family phage protein
MHQSLQIVTASTCEPISRDEAKLWLRLDEAQSEDEGLIDTLVTACRRKVEARTERFFFQTVCALHLDEFPEDSTGVIRLPASPLVSVASITSYNSTDAATVMSSSDYTVDTVSEPGRVSLRSAGSWPSSLRTIDAGVVQFTAGYSTSTGDGSTGLPAACAPMVSAVKLLLAHLYENRQQVLAPGGAAAIDLPYGVEYLLSDLTSPEVEG